jgi:prevent-host-death family protein
MCTHLCLKWSKGMRSVGVRELRERTSEIIGWVRDEGQEVEVTYYGRVVARLVPVPSESVSPVPPEEIEPSSVWADLDQLAAEIGDRWPEGVTAAGAVAEGRRKL